MIEDLVLFETAKLAREKGFNAPCYAWFYIYPKGTQNPRKHWKIVSILEEDEVHELVGGQYGKTISDKYSNSIDQPHILARPTQSLLQKWLREVHKIDVIPLTVRFTGYSEVGYYTYAVKSIQPVKNYKFDTWELAFEAGLQEALNLIP